MTNRELQDLLKQYPDDMPVCIIENDKDYAVDYVKRQQGKHYKNSEDEQFDEAIVLF